MTEKRQIIFLILVFCIAAGLFGWIIQQTPAETPVAVTEPAAGTESGVATTSPIGGPFELADHTGAPVTEENFAGQYKLIFFGFTHCPGICPAELSKMTAVLEDLAPETVERIQPLFITLDPARDTPEVMQDYVSVYHPKILGLTGSEEQIAEVKENYKIYSSIIENEMMGEGNYMVDHSAYTYLMSPENELMLVFDMQDTAEQITQEIREAL